MIVQHHDGLLLPYALLDLVQKHLEVGYGSLLSKHEFSLFEFGRYGTEDRH